MKLFTKTYKDGCVRARMKVESPRSIHLHSPILRHWFSFGHSTLPQIHSRPSVIQSKLSILQVSEMKTTTILTALFGCSLAAPSTMTYAKRQSGPSQRPSSCRNRRLEQRCRNGQFLLEYFSHHRRLLAKLLLSPSALPRTNPTNSWFSP